MTSADQMYGPITTLPHDNSIAKHIPWTTFKLSDVDWCRVIDAWDIFGVRGSLSMYEQGLMFRQDLNRIQQYFSSKKRPTLWHALLALEELQSAWEKKQDVSKYALYHDTLADSLAKIGKYYSKLDEKESFSLPHIIQLDSTGVHRTVKK